MRPEKKAARAIELDPENTAARRVLGEVIRYEKYDQGDFESTSAETLIQAKSIQQILEKRTNLNGQTLSDGIDLAWAQTVLAKHTKDSSLREKAIARISEIVNLEPNSVPALIVLADAVYEESNIDPVVRESIVRKLRQVLRARPHYANAYIVRGNLQAEGRRYEGARNDYIAATRVNPRPATYYLVAITILANPDCTHSDLQSARGYLEKTLRTNPKFLNASDRLTRVYEALGEADGL